MTQPPPYGSDSRCPTCDSPEPRLHPATQAEGEVTHVCPDPFHASWPAGQRAADLAEGRPERHLR